MTINFPTNLTDLLKIISAIVAQIVLVLIICRELRGGPPFMRLKDAPVMLLFGMLYLVLVAASPFYSK